jgi:hypothetical protein
MKTQTMSKGQLDDTHTLVAELVEILRDELAAHHRILQLELTKREAILARDGEKLKVAASEQAKELNRIDLFESRREKLAERLLPDRGEVSLSLIIQSEKITEPEKKELRSYQSALKSALLELKKLSEVNTRMLADSRDLFKTMILSLAGKGADRQHSNTRPVLVDANC